MWWFVNWRNLEPEIVTDEGKNRKTTVAEALETRDEVKYLIKVNRSDHLNMLFNELIENREQKTKTKWY